MDLFDQMLMPHLTESGQRTLTSHVRDTSREAYKEHAGSGKLTERQGQIIYYLRFKPQGQTRSEIAQGTTLRLSSVCGRVNELIKLGVLTDGPRRKCSVTGINSHVVTLTPRP